MPSKEPNEIEIIIYLAVIVILGLLTVALLNFLASIAMTVISIIACMTIIAGITKIIILEKENKNLKLEIEELKNPKQETNSYKEQIMHNKNAYDATKDNPDNPFENGPQIDIKTQVEFMKSMESNLRDKFCDIIRNHAPSFILNFSFYAQSSKQNQTQQSLSSQSI